MTARTPERVAELQARFDRRGYLYSNEAEELLAELRAALASLAPFEKIYDDELSEFGDDISVSLAVKLVAAEQALARAREALREVGIKQWIISGSEQRGSTCKLCGFDWAHEETEKHALNCPAGPAPWSK